jgi:penicillin-binding protein 2
MRVRPSFRPLVVAALLACALSACAPVPAAQVRIPTLAVLPSAYQTEGAERVAREFLRNWQDSTANPATLDFMFDGITFASQEQTPRARFIALYADAAQAMGLTRLVVVPGTVSRERDERASFTYTVEFHTEQLGVFTDAPRTLQLIVDERADDWRVAWTAADLFPELASGGRLRLERTAPMRANIYDRNGAVLADGNGRVVTVSVVRQAMPDPAACYDALARAFGQPTDALTARIDARPASELVGVGTIDAAAYTAESGALEAACAARFAGRAARQYPVPAFAHILGYVGLPDAAQVEALAADGFSAETIIGRSGIEATWDETLRGVPASRLSLVSAGGTVLREVAAAPAQPARSLYLTLDSTFQQQATRIVADAFTQAKDLWAPGSPGASVVVIDVRTGAIRAMVSYPAFDNNAFTAYPPMGREAANALIAGYAADPRRPEINRPTLGVYTLGSVMKTVTAAALADSGVYALDERYTCSGTWNRDIVRTDWFPPGHGTLTLAGSLTQSCNPYYYEAGYQLYMADPDLLPDYAERLGFGVSTGLTDLPEETGFMPNPAWFRESFGFEMPFSEEVNMAIGQGYVQVTPLQVARWFAAIANGGDLPRPYLVEQAGLIGAPLETVAAPVLTPTGLSPDVIAVIHDGMCAVTTESYGTAEFVFRNSPLQALGVCGKTGTAQTGGPETPSHAWFAAYAPRENPEVAIAVLVETAGQGSEVAAPIARSVLEAYFGLD